MPAGNAYPSGHLVPSPIVGLACAPIVETRFLELAMSLLDFSPQLPLDTFSILALPDHTAQTEADKLVTEVICRFGVPCRIHSDQGLEFKSDLFREICPLLGIAKSSTTPYSRTEWSNVIK